MGNAEVGYRNNSEFRIPKSEIEMIYRFDRFLYKKEKTWEEKLLLSPLLLASLPYEWAVRIRTSLYSHGLLKAQKLPRPVISIGNITVGGTGKTPLVMRLANRLKERGIGVAILSRGYRREREAGSIVTDGQTLFLPPEESGDEPFLMARVLQGIPILVGKSRFKIGKLALERFPLRGFLLDDGFQHLSLHRDLNIVLVDSQIGLGDGHLLPRGILREPLSHLKRADIFLLTKVTDREACHRLAATLHRIHPASPVFYSHFEPAGLIQGDGTMESLTLLKGKKVLALSGIANPLYFSILLKKCGMDVIQEMRFPDHHRYTPKDLTSLFEEVKKIEAIVTTEKDLVKLKTLPIDSLPFYALRIDVKIGEEEKFFKKVLEVFEGQS